MWDETFYETSCQVSTYISTLDMYKFLLDLTLFMSMDYQKKKKEVNHITFMLA
jgi:hypothetical protein